MAVTGTSSLRVSGLASGIETDELVKKLLDAQRIPLDKLKQQKQILEWKRDEYRSFNIKFFDFRSATNDMKLSSNYLAKGVSSSNDKVVTGTGTANAIIGQHKIKIEQLAETASIRTNRLDQATQGKDTKLTTLGFVADSEGKIKVTIGGERGSRTIELSSDATLGQLTTAISSQASATGVQATYDEAMNMLFLNGTSSGGQSNIRMSENLSALFSSSEIKKFAVSSETLKGNDKLGVAGNFTLDINGTVPPELSFTVTEDMTVQQFMKKINDSTFNEDGTINTGVSAVLDSAGKLSIVYNGGSTVNFGGSDEDLLTKLGYKTLSDPVSGVVGQNARIEYNGIKQTYNSNNFQIAGINFTAKQVSTEEVTIGVSKDVDEVFNKIKTFVDKYNDLISIVNTKLDEKKYRDFQPLTDEQREAMKDDEIERWEAKAKSGLLKSDPILSSALVSMRNSFSNFVDGLPAGSYKALSDIGISSTQLIGIRPSGSYQDKGKLYLDEDKLRQAIADNPDQVMALFTTDDGDKKTSAGDGVLVRISEQLDGIYSKIRDKAGLEAMAEDNYLMGREIQTVNKRLDAMSLRFKTLETRYYKQFTTMESYLNKMNSQSAWLTQQFSS